MLCPHPPHPGVVSLKIQGDDGGSNQGKVRRFLLTLIFFSKISRCQAGNLLKSRPCKLSDSGREFPALPLCLPAANAAFALPVVLMSWQDASWVASFDRSCEILLGLLFCIRGAPLEACPADLFRGGRPFRLLEFSASRLACCVDLPSASRMNKYIKPA